MREPKVIDLTCDEVLSPSLSPTTSDKKFVIRTPPKKRLCVRRRIRAKKFFLTFPKSNVDASVALNKIVERFNVKWCVVSNELHSDGSPHLHVALWLIDEISFNDPLFWDFITGKHGNYKVMKLPVKCVEYVIKEGKFVSYGFDPEQYISSSKKHNVPMNQLVAEKILDGYSFDDLVKDHAGYVLTNGDKILRFMSHIAETKDKGDKLKWNGCVSLTSSTPHQLIVDWLNENVSQTRDFKQKQLFVYGPPDKGKTSLIMELEKSLNIYHMSQFEDWYDSFFNGRYDLVVLDEFRGGKSIQFLNMWMQGGVFCIKKKGSQYVKRDNLPMIILSNLSLDDCYAKALERYSVCLDALRARLLEIEVNEFIDISLNKSKFLSLLDSDEGDDCHLLDTDEIIDSDSICNRYIGNNDDVDIVHSERLSLTAGQDYDI